MGFKESLIPILPHPVKVMIFEKRGDGYIITRDKARFVRERLGKRYYHYKKHNVTKPIPFTALNKRNEAVLYSPSRDVLVPISFHFNKLVEKEGSKTVKGKKIKVLEKVELDVDVLEEDIRFWVSQEFSEADRKYVGEKSWLEKYGLIIAPLIILVGSGIFFYILASSIGESANLISASVDNFAKQVNILKGTGW